MKKLALICILLLFVGISFGACPSMDFTGDCRVDLADFALFASQWLTEGVPGPDGMVFVTITDDPGVNGHEGFNGEMSKYETTNAQYCHFLNEALASGDVYVSGNRVYGSNGSNDGEDFVDQVYFATYSYTSSSQITFNGTSFSVRSRDGYSMANHPVVEVSWYGATAFCNYYGYRLPTEWEWQAVADHHGEFTYGCGTTINFSKANYYSSGYANPLSLSSPPFTSPVDYFDSYGYGVNDMAGNVKEWTDSAYYVSFRVFCGGSWGSGGNDCTVGYRENYFPYVTHYYLGFRACR